MRKDTRTPSKLIALLCLFLLSTALLWPALSEEQQLLALRIETSDYASLLEMAASRGIPITTAGEMQEALLAYHGLSVEREALLSGTQRDFEVTIAQADSITRLSSSLFIAEGGVHITITTLDDGRSRTISADRLIIDIDTSRIIAHSSVLYEDEEQMGSVEAAILSFDWSNNNLFIVDALLFNEYGKEGEEPLVLYNHAETVRAVSLGELTIYRQGVIAMRTEDPLSSIKATQMTFRPGGDLLAKGATVQIGRVPLLWVPFFPFIQNRMVGNPAIGINSDRGMFVSTTWELVGRYPKIGVGGQSDAVALFSKKSDEDLTPGTIIYTKANEVTGVEAWAKETSSYVALFADAYEQAGVSLGLDTNLSLLNKRLTISGLSLLAVYPDGVETLTALSEAPPLRYLAEPVITFDASYAKLSLELPLYSDPSVKSLYANRLTAFTIEGPLGKALEFPTDFKGDITTAVWKLNASFTFPSQYTKPYLSSLTIPTLTAQVTRKYKYDKIEKIYGWEYTEVVLPNLTARAAGTVFSFKKPVAKKSAAPNPAPASKASIPSDPLLVPFYAAEQPKKKSTTSASREITLSYTAEQRFNQRLKPESGEKEYRYSLSKGSLRLFATPHSTWLTVTEELAPQLSIVEDLNKKTFYTKEAQLFLTSRIAVPIVGLEYQLSQRLARSKVTEDTKLGVTVTEEGALFTKEQVTTHRLLLSKSFALGAGSIKGSVTMVLPPLQQSLVPLLTWQSGPVTLSASAKFLEEDEALTADQVSASFKYSDGLFTASFAPTYRLKEEGLLWSERLSLSQAFSWQSPSKFWNLGQTFDFSGASKTYGAHYVDRLSIKAQIPHLLLSYSVSGPIEHLKPLELKGSIALLEGQWRFYKRRIALFWGIESSLSFQFQDTYASKFEIQASLGLSIAEFLDCTVSVKSVNTGFYRYWEGDDFIFARLWEDLARSFDFVGNGRRNTQFNLSSVNFDLVHDLGDWSLNCKYSASVVLSNNQYEWVPTVSVFLTWKMMSELDIAERWTRDTSVWVRSAST